MYNKIFIYSNGIYIDKVEFEKVCTDVINRTIDKVQEIFNREKLLTVNNQVLREYYSQLYNIISSS